MFKTYTVLTHRSWGVVKQFQERPELVCQRMSEEVDFSGVLEAILNRLEIVVYLSSCLVVKSKLVRYCPQARAQRGISSIRTEEERLRRAECRVAGEVPEHHRQLRGRALELDKVHLSRCTLWPSLPRC